VLDSSFYTPPDLTAPYRTSRLITEDLTTTFVPSSSMRETDLLREAFGDLHGRRLHGFAVLVALGDGERAERAAALALDAGEEHATALRHPERAAAWLRARVVDSLRRQGIDSSVMDSARRASLADLGVAGPAFDGLAALSPMERAALVASVVEGFEPIDVETILDLAPTAARRITARALERYQLAATPAQSFGIGAPHGSLARRVQEVAGRALSPTPDDAR
jgi:DNA-directed RNA polymerase specialized sigma24 family protein